MMNRNATDERSSDQLQETDAPSSQLPAPMGFCPHCEYAINPGICPECGAFVAHDQIDREPRTQWRRRRWRRLVIAIVAMLALSGLSRFYQSGYWYRWLSTGTLLSTDRKAEHANIELFRRYQSKSLTASENRQLINRFVSLRSKVRSPRPKGPFMVLRLELERQRGFYGTNPSLTAEPSLQLEGYEITLFPGPHHQTGSRLRYDCHIQPPLEPGTHKLTGTASVWFDPGLPGIGRAGGAGFVTTMPFEQEIVVLDEPVTTFVTPRNDERTQAMLRENCSISICPKDDREYLVNLCVRRTKSWIAGKLELSFDGEHEPFAEASVSFRPNASSEHERLSFDLPADRHADSTVLRVRFVPDLHDAFFDGREEAVSCQMDWLAIPLPTASEEGCSYCNCCKKPYTHKPDSVIPYDADNDNAGN